MEPTRFDEFTKVLATPTTRRQALKAIAASIGGTATFGGILGLRGLGTALADNSACARFCVATFGEDSPAVGQCINNAAHRTGLCYSCGSNTPPSSVCCTRNASGFCTSYSGATCCSGGQTCQNGTCVTPCAGLQQTCNSASQCCSGNCSVTVGIGCPETTVCCLGPDATGCITDCDCCGDNPCKNGICTPQL
jgi:hypothetical protein